MFGSKQQQQQCPGGPAAAVLPLQKRRSAAAHQRDQPSSSRRHGTGQLLQQCICERPTALVVCRRCGHDLSGRVLRPCLVHPRRIALMDLRECPQPQCRSVQLVEVSLLAELP